MCAEPGGPHDALLPPGLTTDIVGVDEPRARFYELTVATRDAGVCAALPSNAALLRGLNGTVLRHTEGWWTYELTLGGAIRQFHDEGGGKEAAGSVIGTYDWAAGEALDTAALGAQPALVQAYTGGSACGVKGNAPRRASVRFECAPLGGGLPPDAGTGGGGGAGGGIVQTPTTVGLVAIREPETCTYEFTLASSAPCGHPDVQPSRGRGGAGGAAGAAAVPPPTSIDCYAHFEVTLAEALQPLLARAAASSAGGGAHGGAHGGGAS